MPTTLVPSQRTLLRLGVCAALLISLVFTTLLAAAQETPTPTASGYRRAQQATSYAGDYTRLYEDVDAFWREQFAEAGTQYASPDVIQVTKVMNTSCGWMFPEDENAYYCPANATVYFFPPFMARKGTDIGDFAPIVIAAHEWGHHIQFLLKINEVDSKQFELQADCLAGVFTSFADDVGLLEEGDYLEAIDLAVSIGDDKFPFPIDNPDAHGTSEERVKALNKGFGGGPVVGCGVQLGTSPTKVPGEKTPRPDPTPAPHSTLTPTPGPLARLALPNVLPLGHAACFGIVDDGTFSFDRVVSRLGDGVEGQRKLEQWGWNGGEFRQFGCDGPPVGEAGWIDINLHHFANASAARQAVDYFVTQRIVDTSLTFAPPPDIGAYVVAVTGPAVNGTEYTLYTSSGATMLRVTGVSPSGIPESDVIAVARAILGGETSSFPTPVSVPLPEPQVVSALVYLPARPALNYGDCFDVIERGEFSYRDIAQALAAQGLSAAQVEALGWQGGAYVAFSCPDAPFGRATYLDVTVHQFQDGAAAQQARQSLANVYQPREHESRACEVAGALVICVTGQSATGSPLSDVYFLLSQVRSSIR